MSDRMGRDDDSDNDTDIQEEVEDFNKAMYIDDCDRKYIYELTPDRKHKYWLTGYARGRVMSNQNYIVIFTGSTGSGKSYNAMELALDLDPNFNVDRIVFKPTDFITVTKQKLPKGSVIMWDEVGVGLSAREWFSIQNRMISYVLETFRRDNYILIMTTPNISFIDKKVRALLHGYAETIDKTFTGNQFGFVKYFHIVVSLREAKMMYRYPRIKDGEGRTRIVKGRTAISGNMRFSKPPDEITKPYEEKKYEFTETLKDEAFALMTGTGKDAKNFSITDMVEEIGENPEQYGVLEEDESIGNIVNTAFVELSFKYPNKKISKSMVDASIKYIIQKQVTKTKVEKPKEKLDDSMLNSIKEAYSKNRDVRTVAKLFDVNKETLKLTISSWKKRGLWE